MTVSGEKQQASREVGSTLVTRTQRIVGRILFATIAIEALVIVPQAIPQVRSLTERVVNNVLSYVPDFGSDTASSVPSTAPLPAVLPLEEQVRAAVQGMQDGAASHRRPDQILHACVGFRHPEAPDQTVVVSRPLARQLSDGSVVVMGAHTLGGPSLDSRLDNLTYVPSEALTPANSFVLPLEGVTGDPRQPQTVEVEDRLRQHGDRFRLSAAVGTDFVPVGSISVYPSPLAALQADMALQRQACDSL